MCGHNEEKIYTYWNQPLEKEEEKTQREELPHLPNPCLYGAGCIFSQGSAVQSVWPGRPSLGRFLMLIALATGWRGSGLSAPVGGRLLTPIVVRYAMPSPSWQMDLGELFHYQKPMAGSTPALESKGKAGTP